MSNSLKYILVLFLLIISFTKAESQVLRELTTKFEKYCREVPREEVYVHTDRNEYIAGEEIWFSTYLYNRLTDKPAGSSSIIYIEVLNQANQPVGQKRVLSDRGFGSGEIFLPDTIETGCYTIRAYTSWMKNFFPFNCFNKKINVYHALNAASGVACRKETVKQADPDLKRNFSFAVDNSRADIVNFVITADQSFRSPNSNLCYIFIETRGKINHTALVNLNDDQTRYSIPSAYLTPGVNHITFFDIKGNPVTEKYIYTRGNGHTAPLIISPDSATTRKEFSISLALKELVDGKADSSSFSISVHPVTGSGPDEISDFMVFGSEFGILPDEMRGKNPDEIPVSVMNSFLETAHSNWIDWNAILGKGSDDLLDMAEKESHFMSGRLLDKTTRKPLPGKILFLSIPGKTASFQYAVTNGNGIFRFVIPVSQSLQEFVIQPEENDKNITIEMVSSFPVAESTAGTAVQYQEKDIPLWLKQLSTDYQLNRIYGITFSTPVAVKDEKVVFSKRFYGKPEQELRMDDYIKLPVMQEVFYELVPGVSLKSRKNNYEMLVVDPVDNRFHKKPPTILMDGVIINDANAIANIDPELVEKIDIIREKYFVGDYIFYGIINVITRAGDFSHAVLPEKAIKLTYRVIDPESVFRQPSGISQGKDEDNIPDFRNTVYWNPSLKPSADGKYQVSFRTPDLKGDYVIDIQGLTSDGKAVSTSKRFTVK